jgi:hypothetical protein
MRTEHSKTERAVRVEYTSKPVSGWGGLVAISQFFDRAHVREFLERGLPDSRESNNQIPVVDMVLQFLTTVLTGGKRFDHVERVRDDEVVRRILRAKRLGSASSLTRYLGNFQPSQSEHLHVTLSAMIFEMLRGSGRRSDVVDLDSTVLTRHGHQQGSVKGYNPHRRGARSHHPLLAMMAKTKVIAHAWLREGSASPHRGCVEFMTELLSRLPEGFRIEAVRADSGFYSRKFMSFLEEHALPYAIAAKMVKPFQRWAASLSGWVRVGPDLEITEAEYKAPKASHPRRMIVIRQAIRRISKGTLFEIVDYEHRAIATSLAGTPLEIWRFYQHRGDCENRIKELKYDFNADEFCLQSFAGTEVAFRLICFLFNLVALFKATILRDTRITLGTIRAKIFVVGASIGSSARNVILRLGLTGRWRREFDILLGRVQAWSPSTAAQLLHLLQTEHLEPPSRWTLRTVPMLRLLPY